MMKGGRIQRKATGESGRLGPKKPARVENKVLETHCQENNRRGIEAQQALA